MNTVEERFEKLYRGLGLEDTEFFCDCPPFSGEECHCKSRFDKLLDFLQSEIAQAKLEVVEEIEKWLNRNEEIEKWLNRNADTDDCNGSRQLSHYYLERLEHKLTELKSTLEEKKEMSEKEKIPANFKPTKKQEEWMKHFPKRFTF